MSDEKIHDATGKEAEVFWWRASVIEPFITCVPIFGETLKSVTVKNYHGETTKVPKDGLTCSYFHKRADALTFVKDRLELRAAQAHQLAQNADSKLRRFIEEVERDRT